MGANSKDMKIHKSQTTAMQSILLSMSKGYVWHTSGQVDTEKAHLLVEKFDEKFGVRTPKLSLTRRATRQSRSSQNFVRTSTSLVIHPVLGGDRMRWVLLSTGPLNDENMLDGSKSESRLHWDKYQLFQAPKGDGITWTWRLSKRFKNELESRLIRLARSDQRHHLESSLRIVRNYSMFSGVRAQVQHAIKRAVYVWNSQHPNNRLDEPQPLPIKVPMVAYDNPPRTIGTFQEGHRLAVLEGFMRTLRVAPQELESLEILT